MMALSYNRAIEVRPATSTYDTLMKNYFKDWSQSSSAVEYSISDQKVPCLSLTRGIVLFP